MDEKKTIPQLETIDSWDNNLLFPVDTGIQTFNMTLLQLVNHIKSSISTVPAGSIFAFAGAANKVPFGYFLCDGKLILRNDYPDLYTAIGLNHGSTSIHDFRLPDYRGRFLRMMDYAIGRDPDRTSRTAMNLGGSTGDNIGSVQDDAFKAHAHTFVYRAGGSTATANSVKRGDGGHLPDVSSSTVGSLETRPKNAYVNYIIKI